MASVNTPSANHQTEYIQQLEGELAGRANENNELKRQNHALMEENARFRTLAEKLLGHPAFHPFLEELSHDRDLAESLSKASSAVSQGSSSSAQPSMNKDVDPFAARQQYLSPHNNVHVGMTLVPETTIDLSSLNLGTANNWAMPSGMQTYQQPQVFAVTELPQGPAEPLDIAALSGKTSDDLVTDFAGSTDEKVAYPEVENPVVSKAKECTGQTVESNECQFDENDPTEVLFANPSSIPVSSAIESVEYEPIFGDVSLEKAFAHFELFVSSDSDNQLIMEQFERMTARLDASCRRLESLTAGY